MVAIPSEVTIGPTGPEDIPKLASTDSSSYNQQWMHIKIHKKKALNKVSLYKRLQRGWSL